jgi:hypothetical protein
MCVYFKALKEIFDIAWDSGLLKALDLIKNMVADPDVSTPREEADEIIASIEVCGLLRMGDMGGVASHRCGPNGSWVRSSARVLHLSCLLVLSLATRVFLRVLLPVFLPPQKSTFLN